MHTQLSRCLLTVLLVAAVTGCSKEESSQKAEDYLNRAEAYQTQGQYRAAMIEITNAMNAAPQEVQYPLVLAEMYIELGAARRASSLLEDYADEHPQEVALTLAEAYLLQGKFLSAEETLEGFEPQNPEQERLAALYRADVARIRGNLEQSEEAYRALLEQYPDDREIRLRLVENHMFRGQADAARELLATLRSEHPEDDEVLQLSAVVALQTNDLEQAENYLSQALIHTPEADIMLPDRAAILELLSETLTAQGRTSEALVYSKVLAEESPDTIEAQQQLREAVSAAGAGELEKAESLLQELLEENPDSQRAALLLGMVNLRQGNLNEAEPLLSESVDVETANTELIRATAMAQAQSGNAELALQTLERSLKARPDEPVLNSLYGMLALNVPGYEQDGYLSLQKALAQDPHLGGVRLALARYHLRREEPQQAMAQLRSAFNYQPADWDVTNVYMNQLLAQGELDEMAEAVATLKEAAPKARETELFESQYLFRSGNQERAVRQLRALIQSDPNYARAHSVLTQMYQEQGQSREALESLERLLALEPANDQALRAGVGIIANSELEMDPQAWLRDLANRNEALKPNTTALRAMLHRDNGDLERAANLMSRYKGERNNYVEQVTALVYRDRARQLASEENYDEARALLSKALESFPNSKTLNLDLVRLELAEERYEQANLLLDDLKERHPEDADITLMQARATQAEKGNEAAYQQLRDAWEAKPDDQLASMLVGLAREQDPEAVGKILQQWEDVAPESRRRLLFMAQEYQRQGDEAGAIVAYEQLLEQNPNDPLAMNNLAWLLKDKELPRAAALAERAAQLQPDSAAIVDTYGWLLHLQGDDEAALEQLERAAELAPEVEEIQKNLETVRNASE
ncbi:tetratricopeptide repeat protein [Marinimicrobium sp. C2-29]|uniref:tetratricopeptide repeat protein n=1 Tax=Marinimicrobium sp. C2-29 TaxID=3139825 RepID=UPI0031386500